MARVMFLLSLLAATAGTPLRQAEAAHDLGVSLGETGDGDRMETVDGGVGDDAGDTLKADATHAPTPLAPADALHAPALDPARHTSGCARPRWPGDGHPPPTGAAGRIALLQSFLF